MCRARQTNPSVHSAPFACCVAALSAFRSTPSIRTFPRSATISLAPQKLGSRTPCSRATVLALLHSQTYLPNGMVYDCPSSRVVSTIAINGGATFSGVGGPANSGDYDFDYIVGCDTHDVTGGGFRLPLKANNLDAQSIVCLTDKYYEDYIVLRGNSPNHEQTWSNEAFADGHVRERIEPIPNTPNPYGSIDSP